MSLLSNNLDAFIAVAEEGSVQGASKKLGLTQTGVTQRIKALERELEMTLFTRSRKGMRPTAEGEMLLRHASKVVEMEGELFANIKGEQAKIRLAINAPSSMMRTRVIPILAPLKKKYPQLSFSLKVDDSDGGLQSLKKGECDLAILPRKQVVDELDSKLLRPEEYTLVTGKQLKGTAKEIVTNEQIVDFNPEDTHTFNFLKQHRLFALAGKERHYINNIDGLASYISSGGGYSVLSRGFISSMGWNKVLRELLPDKVMKVDAALCWYPRQEMPSYFKDLISSVK